MQPVTVNPGAPQALSPSGPTLVVLNQPWLDWKQEQVTTFGLGYVLVGLGAPADTAAHADLVVPPGFVGRLPVPSNVTVVYLSQSSDYQAWPFNHSATPITVWAGWDETREISLRPVIAPDPLILNSNLAGWWNDSYGNQWAPQGRYARLLDQGLGNSGAFYPALRPPLAPSTVVTAHLVLVANTLTAIPGLVASATNPPHTTVLRRLILSTSAAALIVVGTASLNIGSPGGGEVARISATAAGVQPPLSYDEGLSLNWYGDTGTWRIYASAGVTVDLTAILA